MAKSLIESYTDELEFLISLKQAVSILNNRIHDKLSWIAVEKLRTFHPELNLCYDGAGVSGIDIRGHAKDGALKLIAEVKATHTSETVGLRGAQKRAIERDLQRLQDEPGELIRYLIVVSEQTEEAIERQINPRVRYPKVRILDAIGLVQLVVPREDDDAEE